MQPQSSQSISPLPIRRMRSHAVQHRSRFTPFGISFIRVSLALLLFPLLIEHLVILTLETLVLFTVPLCILAYYTHSHAQMHTKNFYSTATAVASISTTSTASTGTTTSTSSISTPPSDPALPIRPPVFTKPSDDVSKRESSEPWPPARPHTTTTCSYVPTIPQVVNIRRATAPAPPLPRHADLVGPPGPILEDGAWKFRVEGLIAAGTYGRVARATVLGLPEQSSNREVAIKVYCKDRLIADQGLHDMYDLERRIMVDNAKEDCQWLVQARGLFGDPWNRYLIMDYYPNTLSGVIFDPTCHPLPKKIFRLWVEELILAMCELYNRRIVHCDLKPGNILISKKGHLAIADFGISLVADSREDDEKEFEECIFHAYGGTYAYQAPEMLISRCASDFTCAVDMWSLGVIMYEMYTGKRLFSADDNEVRNEVWGWDLPSIISKNVDDVVVQNMLVRLLELDPAKRIILKDLMCHMFFDPSDWDTVWERRRTSERVLARSGEFGTD
ncbi:kinase-like domain-containing protein [Russula compacta]|nr:kinase-like domain-containing protein [Russula compacta]